MVMLCLFLLIYVTLAVGSDITRDFYGDIFRMRDCHNGSRCDNGGARPALEVAGRPCFCQCAPTHLTYREDKQQCVKDIRECYMSVFYRPFTVEAIPLVYLPTSGQLVHPEAHLSLSGRRNSEGAFPSCKAAVSQYLTPEGWRTLTRVDGGGPVFGLFTDGNKTFLQFLGNSHDRRQLQQHLAMVRLFCSIPEYSPFETCVAVRVGWVPGIDSDDMEGSSTKTNMMVVGLSLGILGLVYVLAVLVYLKIRRKQLSKRRRRIDHEGQLQTGDDHPGNAGRMETSKRLDMYHTMSMGKRKLNHEPWSELSSVVETYNRTWTDRMGQGCEFRAQDFQIEPEFFDPEFLASPPREVQEYLERLQSSVTYARHRLRSCYRYQPTLNGIPEDDYFYQELKNSKNSEIRTTPDGGSSSSIASLLEMSDNSDEKSQRDHQKVPPKKPKRKDPGNKSSSVKRYVISEEEEKDIQNAMNTLNDTLDALEYDIYKQDLLQQSKTTHLLSASCPNSTEGDTEDFDSSSCSSLSAVTVLGRNLTKQVDINSTGSRSVEKNQSEEFSTFSNSTFSLNYEAVPGLFNHQNESDDSKSCTVDDNSAESGEQSDTNSSTQSQSDYKSYAFSDSISDNFRRSSPVKSPKKCQEYFDRVVLPDGEETNSKDGKDNGHLLKKSSSSESMTTIATDMTSDSLESRASSPSRRRRRRKPVPSNTPSLVDMWIGRIIQNSVPPSMSKRKPKKMILSEDEIQGWEHICQKQQETCPVHDLNDAEPNLIDKLAHYSSKTMAGRDVAGYFQSLKQDILKDHLKSWLSSNNQTNRKGISVKYKTKDSCPKKPLVPYAPDTKDSNKNGLSPRWTTFNSVNGEGKTFHDSINSGTLYANSLDSKSELIDSLDLNSIKSRASNEVQVDKVT